MGVIIQYDKKDGVAIIGEIGGGGRNTEKVLKFNLFFLSNSFLFVFFCYQIFNLIEEQI